jgi:hypothetical protein
MQYIQIRNGDIMHKYMYILMNELVICKYANVPIGEGLMD